ncbi:UNVERIFIED_ORG: hypothetical protein JN05_04170 [Zoogloea ramigera]|uniref:Lipoprotein n=1 Tax=Duganella zoogloeoides TaxID=75659 RepID=A0ABZ0XYR1_9BURK|nr:hypothetical protein [Duganella zoogloeoides]WQH04875.1 hypothetical protein SR858_00600 [Duganella zoogloeoides]
MKFSYAGALVALTLASLLSACGGKAQYTVQGSVSGLTVDGLQLSNGGNTIDVPKGASSFAFPQQIDYGTEYDITITRNPDYFTCGVSGGTGSAGYTVSIGAAVSCTPNSYTVGGTYSGLVSVAKELLPGATAETDVANKVTLINGSGSQVELSSATATSGTFTAASLTNGEVYSISILKQPNKLTCSLTNPNGVIRAPNSVTNLTLTCVPST